MKYKIKMTGTVFDSDDTLGKYYDKGFDDFHKGLPYRIGGTCSEWRLGYGDAEEGSVERCG